MNIVFGGDHAGVALKHELVAACQKLGHHVTDVGPLTADSVDYPDFAAKACAELTQGRATLVVLICGTGIGMSIAANKVHGVRAALCHTEFEARMTRAHNDANVLCLGSRVTGSGVALAILEAFLSANFEGGRHQARLEKLRALEALR